MARVRVLAFLFSFWVVGAAARADPVQITSGTLTVSGAQDFLSRGFLRSIGYDFTAGDLRLEGSDSDGPRQQILAPALPRVGYLTSAAGVRQFVFLESAFVGIEAAPSLSPTPFVLNGRLRGIDESQQVLLFDTGVFGWGLASWQFVLTPGGAPVVSGVTYAFSTAAPTPEPSTLLLLGSGIVALGLRRRSTTRRQPQIPPREP